MHYMRFWKHGNVNTVIKDVSATKDFDILKIRFERKFIKNPETDCWVWISSKRKACKQSTYQNGEFVVDTKKVRAHRFSYELYIGAIHDDCHVLHKCNNSLCVNPDHLYLGTHAENMRDMAVSGRAFQKKLSDKDVLDIYHSDLESSVLAKKYNVDRCSIKRIRNGKTHRHITGL